MLHHQCLDISKLSKKTSNFFKGFRRKQTEISSTLKIHYKIQYPEHWRRKNTVNKYSSINENAQNSLSERFVQYLEPDTILQFIHFPYTIPFEDLSSLV